MIAERHYDDETLIALVETGEAQEILHPHLASCSPCAKTLHEYRDIADVLRDGSTWNTAAVSLHPSSAALDRLRKAVGDLTAERAEAVTLTASLMGCNSRERAQIALGDLRYHTMAVVRELVLQSEAQIDVDPGKALELSRLAVELSDRLMEGQYATGDLRTTRGVAWRQYGYSLFYTGRYQEADQALERSRLELSNAATGEYELGRLNIAAALVHARLERIEEGLRCARHAVRIFTRYGDRERIASANNAVAFVLMDAQRFAEALPVLQMVEREHACDLSLNARARVLFNTGQCLVELNRLSEAITHYQMAGAMFEEEGMVAEAIRLRLDIGTLLHRDGRLQEAKRCFQYVSRQARAVGMSHTAIEADLDLVEILAGQGEFAEVRRLCAQTIRDCEGGGLGRETDALTALAYLREAVEQQRLTTQQVRHVKTYIGRLASEPTLLFAHPPPPSG